MTPGTKGRVQIVEVGPRDGLQNIRASFSTSLKLKLIRRLLAAGLQTVELTSIVSPRAVPQLSDSYAVLSDAEVQRAMASDALRCPVLIPNMQGLQIAKSLNVREIAVFVSAAEGFSRANIKCSVQGGLDRAKVVAHAAQQYGMAVRGYVSCICACPFDGPTPHAAVSNCTQHLLDIGCYQVSLGDTVGVACAAEIQRLLRYLADTGIPLDRLAGHFHDTYGQALANVWAAYQCGLRAFDSSVAGLGGCPFAPGARGNLATEDVVYMFQQAGIDTGVDLMQLAEIGGWVSQASGNPNGSRAGAALVAKCEFRSNSGGAQEPLLVWQPFKSASRDIKVWRSGTNLKLEMNRPRSGNALTIDMISELTALFENAAIDPTISRIAITGRGKYFCTGMDLGKDVSSKAQQDKRSASEAQFQRLSRLFQAIDKAPQVTVACVQGPAYGGGVGLTFSCDIRIMARSATMTLSEAKLGLCPAVISKYVIREWGPALARNAMLFARPVQATELAHHGLIAQIVDDAGESALLRALDETLMTLRTASPGGSAMIKELVKLNGSPGQAQGIRAIFNEMMTSSEAAFGLEKHRAGVKAVDWDAYAMAQAAPGAKL